MPKFIIHVGPPKTASTYLQMALQKFGPQLRKLGIWYPEIWWTHRSEFNHAKLFLALNATSANGIDLSLEDLKNSNDHTIVLSSEGFSALNLSNLSRLRALIGQNECKIVYYCRRWSDWIPSNWQERVRGGVTTETLPEVWARVLRDPIHTHLNIGRHLALFANVFGADSIQIISLSNLVDNKEDLFVHFCSAVLGLRGNDYHYEGELANESEDIYTTELMRCLNAIQQQNDQETRNVLNRNLIRYRSRLMLQSDIPMLFEAMTKNIGTIIFDDHAPVLQELQDRTYEKFGQMLLNPELAKKSFFNRRALERKFVRQDYLLVPGVANAINGLTNPLIFPGSA